MACWIGHCNATNARNHNPAPGDCDPRRRCIHPCPERKGTHCHSPGSRLQSGPGSHLSNSAGRETVQQLHQRLPPRYNLQPGGSFKLFGGRIEGRNIELTPNERIVQAWREASWPRGLYSLVKFELAARNAGTRIVFDQTGIAEHDWGHLSDGWSLRYWEPLHRYLKA